MYFGTSSPNISQALLGILARRMSLAYAPCWSHPGVRGTAGSFLPSRISFQSQGEDKGLNSEFTNGCVEGGKQCGDSVLCSTMAKASLTHFGKLMSGIRVQASSEEVWSLPRWRCPSPQSQQDGVASFEQGICPLSGLSAGLDGCQVWEL
jgi:hypothetical protein